tara:strand:+ start:2139 stop:2990 length:852 start_codon:yes stop_codon:yes gene_type:complete
MRLFVTGSNGYLGRNFIKKAIKKNYKIFAVTRKKNNKKIKNVKWLVGSIDKKWRELGASDVLVHFATVGAYNKFTNLEETFDYNVTRSTKLLLNSIKFKCTKWIIISTNKEKKIERLMKSKKVLSINNNQTHFNYALTKKIFSDICINLSKAFKVKCRIIRLFHVYGKDEAKNRLWPLLINHSINNKDLKMTSGQQTYDFNYIDDVVDGLIKCLDFKIKNRKFPQEWDLASGKSMSVRQFANRIWKKNKSKGKIFFSKIKNFDKENYLADKKKLWKINFKNLT